MAGNTTIFIRTGRTKTILTGQAWKDAACTIPYDLTTEVSKIELSFSKPRNQTPSIGPVTANVTTPNGNDFDWTDTTNTFNIEGYWGIQPTLTLVNDGEIIPMDIVYLYVGKTIS